MYSRIVPEEEYKEQFYFTSWGKERFALKSVSLVVVNDMGKQKPYVDGYRLLRNDQLMYRADYLDPQIKPSLHELEEYVRPIRVRDGYQTKTDEKGVSKDKHICNVEFSRQLLESPREGREIIYLDAQEGITTNFLSKSGYEKNQLHVPNIDGQFVKSARTGMDKQANIYEASFFEFIRDDEYMGQHDAWIDYCGTLDGSRTGTLPKADMTLFFQRGLLPRENGFLGLTVCGRNCKSKKEDYPRVIVDWVLALGKDFGYTLDMISQREYGHPSMVFTIFKSRSVDQEPKKRKVTDDFMRDTRQTIRSVLREIIEENLEEETLE